MSSSTFYHLLPRCSCGLISLVAVNLCLAQTDPINPTTHQAPPVPPGIVMRPEAPLPRPLRPMGPTLHSIGDPSPEEQAYLELINRTRANPTQEGVLLANTTDPDVVSAYDYFSVNLAKMMNEMATNPPVPPLSFQAQLIDAARLHSGDMLTHAFQGHYTWDPDTQAMDLAKGPGYRLDLVGYPWSAYGENVFSASKTTFYGHAGFVVDWGWEADGMQTGRGHRQSILSASFREVGVGIVNGSNERVDGQGVTHRAGPQVVTQDFGSRQSLSPFITGVAYYDLNSNGIYDAGEGIGGVTVDVAESAYHAITADAGGFSVPVSGNGSYTVTFSGAGFAEDLRNVSVSNGENLKADFVPTYVSPALSGPDTMAPTTTATYTFPAIGGASEYAWTQVPIQPHTETEGAENGTAGVLLEGYVAVTSQVQASGNASWHFTMPDLPYDGSLELDHTFRVGATGQLQFASRLGYASPIQVARVQVARVADGTWEEIWSRPGTDGPGQSAFETITRSLAAYSGEDVRVRFLYELAQGGSIYSQTSSDFGWLVDDIAFTDVESLRSATTTTVTGTSFGFTAPPTGRVLLQVAPIVSGNTLPAGPEKSVMVSGTAPLQVAVTQTSWVGDGVLQIDCEVNNGPPSDVRLRYRDDFTSAWVTDTETQPTEITPGSVYRFQVATGAVPQRFYAIEVDR